MSDRLFSDIEGERVELSGAQKIEKVLGREHFSLGARGSVADSQAAVLLVDFKCFRGAAPLQ